MNDEQLKHFVEFWRIIDLNERHVRQYGHVGWHPGRRDGWDEQLGRAYEAIRLHLASLRRPFLVATPAEAKGLNPFDAETAHQALMFFLNPPENLFGQIWILTSSEYHRIKQQALAEFERLQTSPREPKKSASLSPCVRNPAERPPRNNRRYHDSLQLQAFLLARDCPHESDFVPEPLSQGEIARGLRWDQPRVSRAMQALFKKGGMKEYKARLSTGMLRGFLKRLADGRTDVEAYDEG